MVITQITDPHIAPETERPFGKNTRNRFLKSLEMQKRERPDLLVITGDLAFRDGDEETYAWIKKQLDKLEVPYRVLPGNHDHPSVLAEEFQLTDYLRESGELYWDEKPNDLHLIFLDSSSGVLSKAQWDWLNHVSKNHIGLPKLIFIHHPPLPGSVPYMDKNHPFREWDQFESFISKSQTHLSVFCGHYHMEKCIVRPNLSVFITPSPFFGINDRFEDFEEATTYPCYRRIVVGKKGLETSVFYQSREKT